MTSREYLHCYSFSSGGEAVGHAFGHNDFSVQQVIVSEGVLRDVPMPLPLAAPDMHPTTKQLKELFPTRKKLTHPVLRSVGPHALFPTPLGSIRFCCDAPVLREAASNHSVTDLHSDAFTRLTLRS